MTNARLGLALDQLHSGVWRDFEEFAAEFISVEYPSMRSTATANGDRGRDGEVFTLDEKTKVGAQYSVAQDYNTKIVGTLNRLQGEGLHYRHLIYATNRLIGANGDGVITKAREEFGVILDIRDRSWFLERELSYPQRAAASDKLIAQYADPLLASSGLKDRAGIALTRDEGRVALLHLALENRDLETGRSLTRSCFDALVLAALNGTDASNGRALSEVQNEVRKRVPTGAEGQVDALVIGTLKRLTKKGPVKLRRNESVYHLSFEAAEEMRTRSAEFLLEENTVITELEELVIDSIGESRAGQIDLVELRGAVEAVLFDRGEAFVAAVSTGSTFQLDPDQLAKSLQKRGYSNLMTIDEMTAVVLGTLRSTSIEVRRHLARLGDAYTLLAFLRQTPDVQKVVVNIFSDGDIWLDTSVVLPLIGETLIEDPGDREFTRLLNAASDAGLQLHVTEGVIEEVERHLNRSYTYAVSSHNEWRSRIPFLYSAYVLSGGEPASFNSWRNQFAGKERPEEDVSEFLMDDYGIDTRNLTVEVDSAPLELKAAAQELWNEVHDRRRTESAIRYRLVEHDVENAIGVIQFRKSLKRSPMGHRAWWLTVDKTAASMGSFLKERLGKDAPDSPVLNPDFLSQLLRLSPLRSAIERDNLLDLPTSTDMTLYDFATPQLLSEAQAFREETHASNDRLLRRGVRDEMERLRRKTGPSTIGNARALEQRVLDGIEGKDPSSTFSDDEQIV